VTRSARPRARAFGLGALVFVALLVSTSSARAEDTRPARFIWTYTKTYLFVSVKFRDVIDTEIQKKLARGFTSTIVFTGTLFIAGQKDPVATTAQTCKITKLVWEDVYKIQITRPGGTKTELTPSIEGVLRRCGETRTPLLTATSSQVSVGSAVYLSAKVQVNPVSQETLDRIKRWVSRPSGTATAVPGDALFSTFTGLFLQRIGEADRELKFTTKTEVPAVQKPPPPPKEKK
jgi:hypothetical protein